MSLNENERKRLTQSVGYSCQIHESAVGRLYTAQQSNPCWNYYCTGFVTVVSDNSFPSYFIRILNSENFQVIFEQEFYHNFSYTMLAPWFHAFEMEQSIGGISFADEQEALRFFNSVITCKMKPLGALNGSNIIPMRTIPIQSSPISSPNITSRPNPDPFTDLSKKERKKMEEKKKKEEKEREKQRKLEAKSNNGKVMVIEGPTNVTHVSHIGFDSQNGFQIKNIPQEWKKLFQTAGVRKSELRNPETVAFIMSTVNNALAPTPPPPVPMNSVPYSPSIQRSNSQFGRKPPSPPVSRPGTVSGRQPPPPPNISVSGRQPPSPPVAPPVAPPIPPPVAPQYEDYSEPAQNNGNDLLSQIRKGAQLKKVEMSDPLPSLDSKEGKSLADTLALAMKQRRVDICEDITEDDDDWEDDNWK